MSRFVVTVSVDTSNSAFDDLQSGLLHVAREVAVRIGLAAADIAVFRKGPDVYPGRIRDSNGNTIGVLRASYHQDCDQCCDSPFPGILLGMNDGYGIQRCDVCDRYASDEDAAGVVALRIGGVVSTKYDDPVVFIGEGPVDWEIAGPVLRGFLG